MPDGQDQRSGVCVCGTCAPPPTPKTLRMITAAQGTVDWWIALTAVTAWRMVAVDSACSPTAKPKQSTRCTTGR